MNNSNTLDPLVIAVGLSLFLLVFSYITARIVQDGNQRIEQILAGQDVPERHENGCLFGLLFILFVTAALVVWQ